MEFLLQLQQLGVGVRGAKTSGQAVFWNEFSCNWEIAFCSFETCGVNVNFFWLYFLSWSLSLSLCLQHVPVWAWPRYIRQQIAFAVRTQGVWESLSLPIINLSARLSAGITNSKKSSQLNRQTFGYFQPASQAASQSAEKCSWYLCGVASSWQAFSFATLATRRALSN